MSISLLHTVTVTQISYHMLLLFFSVKTYYLNSVTLVSLPPHKLIHKVDINFHKNVT